MAESRQSAARAEFFQKLKALCVPLSRLALRSTQTSSGLDDKIRQTKETVQLLEQLASTWDTQALRDSSILDHKIADYVFFPVTHLLRGQQGDSSTSPRVVEASIKLVRTLIQHGWKADLSKELAQQLLLFLAFVVGGTVTSPASKDPQDRDAGGSVPEEILLEGYRTLQVLLTSPAASSIFLATPEPDPSLAHALTVILEGGVAGNNKQAPTTDIRLEALECVRAVFSASGAAVSMASTLATCLPITVSSLTKLLSPPNSARAQKKILVRGLEVLEVVLERVVGDLRVRCILVKMQREEKERKAQVPQVAEVTADDAQDTNVAKNDEKQEQKVLTSSWLRASTERIKLALASVLKLRNHDAPEVQQAVERFCLSLLDACHASLTNCRTMLVETAMMLHQDKTERETAAEAPSCLKPSGTSTEPSLRAGKTTTTLHELAICYPQELGDAIKIILYSWVNNLPRAVTGTVDERVREQALRNVARGCNLAAALNLDSATLEDSLVDALRETVVALAAAGAKKPAQVMHEVDIESMALESVGSSNNAWLSKDAVANGLLSMQMYGPVLLTHESQRTAREELVGLISNLGSCALQLKLAADMLSYVRDSEGLEQAAPLWLAFELLKAADARDADLNTNAFLDLSSLPESSQQDAIFQELYDFSVSILSSETDPSSSDWHVPALCLEISAYAATRSRSLHGPHAFRPELIDILYPIVTLLGASEPVLRSHAIATLNRLADACGYSSLGVCDMLVDNADYMVNAVALRLNTLDISPASMTVLRMMVRVTGARLVPYLEDVVGAIFGALESYHGYTRFVECLFGVLSEVVEQGVRAEGGLLLEKRKEMDHRKRFFRTAGLQGMLAVLEERAERVKRRKQEEDGLEWETHPKEPWGSGKDKGKKKTFLEEMAEHDRRSQEGNGNEDDSAITKPEDDANKSISTPTYTLLARIASLTQYYLTSPDPSLRRSLLNLLTTVAPALSPDENAFLPLVNTLWPVVVPRLRDPEVFVAVAACRALAALCVAAGDFLSSRIRTEWEDGGLKGWCQRARDGARDKGSGRVQIQNPGVKAIGSSGTGGQLAITAASGGSTEILIPARVGVSDAASAQTFTSTSLLGSHLVTQSAPRALVKSRPSNAPFPSPANHVSILSLFSQSSKLWTATLDLLTAVVAYVRLPDIIFDDMLVLVIDELPKRNDLRAAFEAINADAVWLALYERGVGGEMETPAPVDGIVFASLRAFTAVQGR